MEESESAKYGLGYPAFSLSSNTVNGAPATFPMFSKYDTNKHAMATIQRMKYRWERDGDSTKERSPKSMAKAVSE